MDTVQIVAFLSALVFLVQVFYFTSINRLQDRQAFIWITFATIGVFIAIFLNQLNDISRHLGIAYMPSLIYLIAFLTIINLLVFHTMSLARQKENVKNLTQELAYISKELRELKKTMNK